MPPIANDLAAGDERRASRSGRGRRRALRRWIESQSSSAIRAVVFVSIVAFVWGLDTHGNFAGSGDEPHYAMIAHSLWLDHDLDLSNDYADPTNLVGAGGLMPELHAIPGKDGRLRPVHDIGLPLVFVPYFAVAYPIAAHSTAWLSPALMSRARLTPPLVLRHLLSLAMIVLTGILAMVLFTICRDMSGTNASAMGWTLLCVLSPPLLSHAFLFFTEIPSALMITLFYRQATLNRWTARRAAAAGAAVGFLLLLHVRNVGVVVGAIALFAWWVREKRVALRTAVFFLLPIALCAAIRTAVTFHLWGSFITSPHASMGPAGGIRAASGEMATRVLGLLFDQEHGLLLYAPIYLLAIPGALALRARDRRSFWTVSVLAAAYVVPVILPSVNRHGWSGGWAPAARFLVPIAPLLAIMAFGYVRHLRKLSLAMSVLLLAQAALDLLFWSRPKLLWNDGTGTSALAAFASRWWQIGAWLPSWHRPSLYTVVFSCAALAIWIATSSKLASRSAHE
jgi:hypothetical protein